MLWIKGQDIKYRDDVAKIKSIRSRMVELNNEIGSKKLMGKYLTEEEVEEYNKNVDEFNNLVPEFNQIIENSGSRSYLLPIPVYIGSGKTIK